MLAFIFVYGKITVSFPLICSHHLTILGSSYYNYTRNHHTNLKQFYTMFHVQNYILLSFQSFLHARQCCVNELLLIQRPLNKIQGLLGKIQRLFKDLKNFFNFQGFFKGLMLFQVIYQTRATVFHQDIKTPRRELQIRRAAEYF